MASTSLIQQIGGFAPSTLEVSRVPYCNQIAGGGVAVGQTIYAQFTWVDGVLQVASTLYFATGDDTTPVTLTAAQIAALLPGECDREYDEEGDLVCAAGVTLQRIEIYNNSTGTTVGAVPIVIFVNPATNTAVATPAVWTWGACQVIKAPVTARVYVSAVGAVAVPATARREVIVFNRSNRDILVTWTGTLGGAGGTFSVPNRGTYSLSLTEDPNEGLFATMIVSNDLGGAGALTANSVIFDFKN